MIKDLDTLARALRDAPLDRDLSAIEPLVWRRLADEGAWAFFGPTLAPGTALAAARMSLSAIVLITALLAGAAVAGRIGAAPSELAVFSADAPFAPSSLLSL